VKNAADPALDFLTVTEGVFSLLYEKRTGSSIPAGTRIYIRDMLKYIPEISTEVEAALSVKSAGVPLFHALLSSGSEMWSGFVMMTREMDPLTIADLEGAVAVSYEEVQLASEWKKIFGVSYRAFTPGPRMFQAKTAFPDETVIDKVLWEQTAPFAHSLDNSIDDYADATFWPKYNGLPMKPSIARYVLTYYLSSIVRYKPSILAPASFPDYAWVFESFVNSSALNIVTNSADGITARWHMYGFRLRW
jgi:hypothetical protein